MHFKFTSDDGLQKAKTWACDQLKANNFKKHVTSMNLWMNGIDI